MKSSVHRRPVRVAIAAALLAVSALTVSWTATPASAAPSCTSPRHDVNGEGYARMNKDGTNLKKAPYAACGNVRSMGRGDKVYLQCAIFNDYGNVWWWVRVAGTDVHGWMSEDNLTYTFEDENGDGWVHTGWCDES